MIKFKALDFKLCQIPKHFRDVYIFKDNGRVLLTFSTEYISEIIHKHPETEMRRLQATNYLYVPYQRKRIVEPSKMLFELLDPIKQT